MQKVADVDGLDTKAVLTQELIPVGLEWVSELLQQEVKRLAG
jgi:hypothetical protein